METRYLEQFIALEKSQSMRGAAEDLYLSQSALSQNLKKLEAELECQLFDRSRNQLTLNQYGTIMLEHANRIVDELKAAKREIAAEKMRQAQRISVGIYAYGFESFVMPNLANAIQNNVFECHVCDNNRLTAGVLDGALDVIFTDKAVNGDELISTHLFKEQIMISLPATSEFASKQNLTLSDLPKLKIYLVSDASGYTPWFEQVLEKAGAPIKHEETVPFKEYLYTKDNVDQCSMTSSFIVRFLPMAARRVLVPLAEEIATRDIYMIYKKKNAERLHLLVDYIAAHQDHLFTGSSFLPFFLFPGEQRNLVFNCEG